jgi:histidine triad (HIT) family protein
MEDCIFCKIVNGDIPSHKLYEDEHTLAFLDIRPINPGHALVVPKAHAANILESSDEDMQRVMAVVKKITPSILKTVGSESFNLSANTGRAAGQVVFHTHLHIMPRHAADGYEPWQRDDDGHDDLGTLAQTIRAHIAV